MKYGSAKASKKELDTEKAKLKRLCMEQKELLNREELLNEEGMARYNDLDSFLELAKNASNWWKKADDKQKKEMADLLVLNVVIHGNDVASVSLKEPFATWAKRSKSSDGGLCPSELERLRVYHREHGNLGKRYVDVIRIFEPSYTPRTEDELSVLSRKLVVA